MTQTTQNYQLSQIADFRTFVSARAAGMAFTDSELSQALASAKQQRLSLRRDDGKLPRGAVRVHGAITRAIGAVRIVPIFRREPMRVVPPPERRVTATFRAQPCRAAVWRLHRASMEWGLMRWIPACRQLFVMPYIYVFATEFEPGREQMSVSRAFQESCQDLPGFEFGSPCGEAFFNKRFHPSNALGQSDRYASPPAAISQIQMPGTFSFTGRQSFKNEPELLRNLHAVLAALGTATRHGLVGIQVFRPDPPVATDPDGWEPAAIDKRLYEPDRPMQQPGNLLRCELTHAGNIRYDAYLCNRHRLYCRQVVAAAAGETP